MMDAGSVGGRGCRQGRVGDNGYDWAANVNTAVAAAIIAESCRTAHLPLAALQLTPVAAATDSKHPAREHKGAFAAVASSNFCRDKRRNGGHCACGAGHNLAVEVDDEKGKGLGRVRRGG
jgi:hypothetical protein